MRVVLYEENETVALALKETLQKGKIACDLGDPNADFDEAVFADGECPYWAVIIGNVADAETLIADIRSLTPNAPIISLLDMRSADKTIRFLGAGADDVIVKPINGLEITSRIHAIARRGAGVTQSSVTVGKLTIHLDGRDPEVDGERIKLSQREYSIFMLLAMRVGRVVAKEAVYDSVYGLNDAQPYDKVIDVYICKLRKKLADATGGEKYIETVYGRGYKLDEPAKTAAHRRGRRKREDAELAAA